ncbi:MAG: hypothetical protein JW734_01180, partial [Candidatus Omnitrophica bacterium]|nr:hypothetical protein [Candidatus Omnitrophota bacterium]
GSMQVIKWDAVGSIKNIKLEYSLDGGLSFTTIAEGVPNSGFYKWRVPGLVTREALIKISDFKNPKISDISDGFFKIQGTLNLRYPNGQEVFRVGDIHEISWNHSGTIKKVNLHYSTDSGLIFPYLIISKVTNNGRYKWQVPDSVSNKVKIRICDAYDEEVFDTSDAAFAIVPVFAITSPRDGQEWKVGREYNITWKTKGTIPEVKLEYSRDNFTSEIFLIGGNVLNTGMYNWIVPDTLSDKARIRISDPENSSAYSISEGVFRILPWFEVMAPNGSQIWEAGSVQAIRWSWQGNVSQVKLEYSTDTGINFKNIGIVPNTGSYFWLVPDDVTRLLKIRLSSISDTTVYDTSDTNSEIRARFILKRPNGGEVLRVGQAYDITWQNLGIVDKVSLHYSLNNFQTSFEIVSSIENKGVYTWTVPDTISDNLKVRIVDSRPQYVSVYDDSDSSFSIRGGLRLIYPNGREKVKVNTTQSITWDTIGSIKGVKILYSTDSGRTFPYTIVDYIPNNNSYSWIVPDAPTLKARVRVVDAESDEVYDDSDSDFSVQGCLSLISPNGGEALAEGQDFEIIWSWDGRIPFVALSYSTDSGRTFPYLISEAVANDSKTPGQGSYNWIVPALDGSYIKVRVQDLQDESVYDISDSDFKIVRKEDFKAFMDSESEDEVSRLAAGSKEDFYRRPTLTQDIVYQDDPLSLQESLQKESIEKDEEIATAKVSLDESLAAEPDFKVELTAFQALKALGSLEKSLGGKDISEIASSFKGLEDKLASLAQTIEKEGVSSQVIDIINKISRKLASLAEKEGYDIDELLAERIYEASFLKTVVRKVQTLKSAAELFYALIEAEHTGKEAPLISTFLQEGSVRFKIVAANPSKVKSQRVPVKVYLPEEVESKDILDLGGLSLEFDPEKSLYYVYGNDILLEPGQTRTFEVVVEDIWLIPEEEIKILEEKLDYFLKVFEGSEYYFKMEELFKKAGKLFKEIILSQNDPSLTRSQHIGVYRDNRYALRKLKEEIWEMEKILQQSQGLLVPRTLAKTRFKTDAPTKTATWIAIFVIIFFLALLSLVVFFSWHRQARATEKVISDVKQASFGKFDDFKQQEKK